MEAIKTIVYKNHTISVFNDKNPDSPRNDDNIAEFHCSHRRYNLGDDGFNPSTGSYRIEIVNEQSFVSLDIKIR